jgi:ADP-heptose:LPS heptosyltransferase
MARAQGGTAVFLQNRDFFGAMVVHTPLFDALRAAAPDEPLVTYAPFERGRIFESVGLADETHVYARVGGSLWSSLREYKFARIVLLRPQSFGLTALISTAGARRTLGYSTALSKLVLTHTIRRDTTIYRARNYVDLLRDDAPVPQFRECVARLAGRSTRAPDGGRIVLMPCGSEERKLWGERNFVALARRMAEANRDARFTLVIGRGEVRYVELLERAGLGARTAHLVDASLFDIARAVLEASVVVANDCGPAHVAQLSGAPVVLVFGNWDGAVRARIDEWFDPRPGARALTTAGIAPIDSLAVDHVLAAVIEVAHDPRTPARVIEIAGAAAPARTS